MSHGRDTELSRFLQTRFCRTLAQLLVFLMVIQGWPLWELSHRNSDDATEYDTTLAREIPIIGSDMAYADVGGLEGDIDGDCNVDRDDLMILLAERNKPVGDSACGEACDLDGDGMITVLDARRLVLLCTLPRCAIMADSCTENHAPVADAGPDQTVRIGDTVVLDGSGSSDEDGDPLGFNWSLDTPPGSQASLSDPSAILPSFVVDHQGPFVGELIVNDGQEDSAPDQVVISTENSPPVAAISAMPGPYYVGMEVILDGSNSFDVDNDPLTYGWNLIQQPAESQTTIQNPTEEIAYLTPDEPGDYVVELIVHDGLAESDPVQHTITTDNNRPVAAIVQEPENPVYVGDPIQLDGGSSSDADHDPLTYDWALTSLPDGSAAGFTPVVPPDDDSMMEIVPDLPGDYLIQLIVNDGYEDSDPTTTLMDAWTTVPDVLLMPETEAFAAVEEAGLTIGDVVSEHDATVAMGLVLDQDPEGGALLDEVLPVDLWISLGPAMVTVPDVIGLPQTEAEAVIVGTDLTVGAVTTEHSDTVPEGSVIDQSPSGGTSVLPQTAVDLVVSLGPEVINTEPDLLPPGNRTITVNVPFSTPLFAIDPDIGDTLTFSLDSLPGGMVLGPASGELSWTPGQTGGFNVTARVTDSQGAFDTESFGIEVIAEPFSGPTNSHPELDDVGDQSVEVESLLALTATATDPDPGDILTYSLPRAPTGMSIVPATGEMQFTPTASQVGAHDVTLRVVDDGGLADTAAFVVTVTPMEGAPLAEDDLYTARIGETLTIAAPGVLENDTDPNNDSLSAVLIQPPTRGSLDLRPDGSFDYTPTVPNVTTNIQDTNMAMWLRPAIWASDNTSGFEYGNGADGDLNTSWIVSDDDPEYRFRFRFHGVVRPTVKEMRLYGNRGALADGHDIYSGRFRIVDGSGVVVHESDELAIDDPDRDLVYPIPGGPLNDVYQIEFIFSNFEGTAPGFSELEVIAEQEVLDVVREWAFTPDPSTCAHVTMAPVVGDITADGIPDIIFICGINNLNSGRVMAISGADGSEIFIVDHANTTDIFDDQRVNINTQLALGDIDNDGVPEILAFNDGTFSCSRWIKAFRYDVATDTVHMLWTSDRIRDGRECEPPYSQSCMWSCDGAGTMGGPSLADLDGDGTTEIIAGIYGRGVTAFDSQGRLLWDTYDIGLGYGGGTGDGASPVVVDLDLDGTPEIVAGKAAYTNDGQVHWVSDVDREGIPAVANFDSDPYPEIVLNNNLGHVSLLEHDGTVTWTVTGYGGAGTAPAVADFDGDGLPEIGVSEKTRYNVLDTDGSLLWERKITEDFHERTGSIAFDFDGDGAAEVVHSDNWDLTIFKGIDGTILFRTPMGSTTRWEHPVVADVDADGHAELLGVVNLQYDGTDGIHVFGGPHDNWPATRQVWNQHAYHVTNVNADLTIPAQEQIGWLIGGLNNFRQNVIPPEEDDSTADRFVYQAHDGALDSNEATVHLEILPANALPEIVSTPNTTATVGFDYFYGAVAVDADNDPLTFSLTQAPADMTIDPDTGIVRWTPDPTDEGDHLVAVRVEDIQGDSSVQHFTLTVSQSVVVPNVVGQTQGDATSAILSAGLSAGGVSQDNHPTIPAGQISGQEPPGGTVAEPQSPVSMVLSLGPGPRDTDDDGDGFTENQGDCDDGEGGIHPGAVDPASDGIDQDCNGIDGELPIQEILVEPAESIVLVGDQVSHHATAVFEDGTSQNISGLVSWVSSDPGTASVDADGVADALNGGSTSIQASFDGVMGSASLTVHPFVADDLPPVARIDTPENDSSITAPTDIVGTASDDNFFKYELAYASAGEDDFTLIHLGTTPVDGDVLGTLDPTMLHNDLYTVRLTVFDQGGNQSVEERVYQVDGNMKVGIFSLTFTDLQIPMSGLPIKVNRTYDSRDKSKGDFGEGWRLSVQTMTLRSNRVLGTAWQVFKNGLAYQLFPSDTHKVSLTLPDGRVEEFDMRISPNPSVLVPFSSVNASFRPRPGTRGELVCLDDTALLVVGAQPGEVTLTDFTANTFDPQNFRYTSLDGTQYAINKTLGVQSITEPNGNTLTFGPDGIIHSAGKSVLFDRDADGRITQLTDPMGNTQTYAYDGNGDLHSHTDAEGNTTRFFYDHRHGLLRIEDPLNRPIARNEYDDTGRLTATIDGDGNRIEYTHNVGSRQEIVQDRSGGVTVYDYDDMGNVVSETDPLGNTKTYSYDERGNKISQTNALGHVTSYTYDSNDIATSKTDPLGNSFVYDVNGEGELLVIHDPEGFTTSGTYDAAGNPTTKTGPDGQMTLFSYDTTGNRISETDCVGNVTSYEYDAAGNLVEMTNALGHVSTYTYDANGNQTSATWLRSASEGLVTMTTTFSYNGRNQPTGITDPYGNTEAIEYNANGKKSAFTDKNGHRTTYEYDVMGNLIRTTYPDGTEETSSFNANGAKTSSTDRSGNTTIYEYDALNRPIQTVKPDGSSIHLEYDAAGRPVARIDENGNRTEFDYDDAGRLVSTTDASGNQTNSSYDGNGNRTSVTDANGNTTSYTYDGHNRAVGIVFADGSFQETGYLAGCSDLKETITDANGNTTAYEYDAMNRLAKVVDAMGGETSYAYDEVGNRISQTDANGHVTRFVYDHLGGVTKRILPLGMVETFTYDAVGNRLSKTDFNGDTVTYSYDNMNRITSKTYPDTDMVTFTHFPSGQRASVIDARGVTAYSYDTLNRLTSVSNPDGSSISYVYDPKGNKTAMTAPSGTSLYSFDSLNRLKTVTDPAGRITTYTYDAAGRMTGATYPNSSKTSYGYDTLNRLTSVEHRKSDDSVISSYAYTLDAAGNRLQVSESTGRTTDYSYDNLHRLVRETITDPVNGDQSFDYSHDPVGNRISKTDSEGNTIYQYDANDRLLSAGALAYSYDSNGNKTGTYGGGIAETYTYDYDNRLVAAFTSAGSSAYAYDADGLRVQATLNGAAKNYLLDTNRPFAQVIEERDDAGALDASYTYGVDIISQDRAGSTHFYLHDALGTTRQLLDSVENTATEYTYDAFGNLLSEAGAVENAYRFAGEQFDSSLGHYYLRSRYYNPESGRFSSQDSFPGDVFNPVSLHRYQYANGNPVMYVDPNGELSLLEIAIATALILGPAMIFTQVATDVTLLLHHKWTNWYGTMFVASGGSGFGVNAMGAHLESECRQFSETENLKHEALIYMVVAGFTAGFLPASFNWGRTSFVTPKGMLSEELEKEDPSWYFMGLSNFHSLTYANPGLRLFGVASGFTITNVTSGLAQGTSDVGAVDGIDSSLDLMWGLSFPVYGRNWKCLGADTRHASDDIRKKKPVIHFIFDHDK